MKFLARLAAAAASAAAALHLPSPLPSQTLPTFRTACLSGDAAPGTGSTFQTSPSLTSAYVLPTGAATFTAPLASGRQATFLSPPTGSPQLFVLSTASATLLNPALNYSSGGIFILNSTPAGELVARAGAGASVETTSAFFTGSATAPTTLFRSGDTLTPGAGTVPVLFGLLSTRGGSPMVITRDTTNTASWLQIRRAGAWEATPLAGGSFEGQPFVSVVDRVTQANTAGQFLFRARTGSASADSLLLGQNGAYTAIARPGDTLPGHSRPALQVLPGSLNQAGQVALRVEFTAAQTTPVAIPAESGLYLWTASAGPAKVFVPGDAVAALPGAIFRAAESALLAEDGSVLFLASYEQGGVRLTGLFHRAGAAASPITKVVAPGDVPPGLPTNLNVRRIDGYAYNDAGQLVFRATLAEMTQPPVALVGGPPHDLHLLAATGYDLETAAGPKTVTALGPLALTLAFAGENTAQFNQAGQVAFSARFSGSPAPDGVIVATLPAPTPPPAPTTAVLESYTQEPLVIRNNAKAGVTRNPLGTSASTDGLSTRYPLGTAISITCPTSSDQGQQTVFHGWAPTAYDSATGFAPALTTNPLNITLTADRRLVGFRGHPYADVLGTSGRAWRSGGHALWTGTYDVFAPAGGGSARGTSLRAPGEESWLETTVTGPALVSFAWRLDVSTGASARLVALADGVPLLDYATSTTSRDSAGWRRETLDLTATGPVVLRFRVARGQSSGIVFQGAPFPVLNQETALLGNFSTGTFAAPTNLRSIALVSGNFNLGWTPGFGATSQTVELSTSPTFATIAQNQSVSGTASSAFFFGLINETTYYARVTSVRAGNASLVSSTFSITPTNRTAQTINFASIPDRVFGTTAASNTLTLTATASSGLTPVTFAVTSGPATVSGSTLTITGAGTITVEATQAGNSTTALATATRTFEVAAGTPQTQTITFLQPAALTYGTDPVELSATANSGLPVVFQLVSTAPATGVATLDGSTLSVTGVGKITIRATRPESIPYKAATAVTRTITINKADLAVSFDDRVRLVAQPNPIFFEPLYTGFVSGDTAADLAPTRPVGGTTAKLSSAQGDYPITFKGGLDKNYRYVPGAPAFLTVVGYGGTYEALLVDGASTPVGKLSLLVSKTTLGYTGTLNLARETKSVIVTSVVKPPSATTPLVASEDLSSATATWVRTTAGLDALFLTFTVNTAGELTGALTRNGEPFATLASGRLLYAPPARTVIPWAGQHTLALHSAFVTFPVNEGPFPRGSGVATAVVSTANGNLVLAGKLADGTTLTATLKPWITRTEGGALDQVGYVAWIAPYGTRTESFLAGSLALQPHPESPVRFPAGRRHIPSDAGLLTWKKAGNAKDKSYRDGFGPLSVSVSLDPWLPPVVAKAARGATPPVVAITLPERLGLVDNNTTAAMLTLSHGPEEIDLGELEVALPFSATLHPTTSVTAVNALTITEPVANLAKWKLSTLNPNTGAFTGSFILSDQVKPLPAKPTPRTVIFTGTLRQAPDAEGGVQVGTGFFLLPAVPTTPTPVPLPEQPSGEIRFTAP